MKFLNILFSISVVFGIATAKAIENIDNTGYTKLVETKSFKYNFSCVEDHNDICNTLRKNLDSALNVLENTFEVYQPIVFDMYIDDLSRHGLYNITGGNFDTNYVPLRLSNDTNSPPYLFPQSLVKQLILNKEPDYESIDFVIAMDNMKRIEDMPEYGKLDAILLHEITHALGFLSFVNVKPLSCSDKAIPLIYRISKTHNDKDIFKVLPETAPYFDSEVLNAETLEEFNYQSDISKVSFYPLTIFEKNIVDAQNNDEIFDEFGYLFRDFEKCFGENATFKDITFKNYTTCFNNLSSEKKELITFITDNYLTKENSIGFLTNNGNVVPLQTFNDIFLFGSSVSHTKYKDMSFLIEGTKEHDELNAETLVVDEEFAYSHYDENFLMNFAGDNLTRDLLFKTVAKNNTHGLMGPGIVDILKTMGWTEKGDSKNNNQYYLAEDVKFYQQNKFEYLLVQNSFPMESPEMPSDLPTDELQEVEESCDIYLNNNDYDNTDSDSDYEVFVSVNDNDYDNNDSDSDYEVSVSVDGNDYDNTDSDSDFEAEQ